MLLLAFSAGGAVALPKGIITTPAMTMSPTAGDPGTTVTFTSITGCIEGAVVNLGTVPNPTGSAILASGNPDATGDWSLSYVIPMGTPPGAIDFYVTCALVGGGFVYEPETFTVTAPPSTSSLPTTSTVTSSTSSTTSAPPTTGPTPPTTLAGPSITLDKTTVPQGGQVTVTSTGWMPGTSVQVTLNSDPLDVGTAIADQVGTIVHTFTVPVDFLVGAHSVTLTGLDLAGQVQVLSADLQVTALAGAVNSLTPTTTAATGALPRTGSGVVFPLAVAGAGLALGGAGLLVASRRRQTSNPT
ncbi:MAG: LPXTG cell wall anchor domain-containing protein [Acidimicrobiales bacterium]|nr:LPXTG cell wall anchor domain-containing protein [Acidimicrobiales bacterium]